MSMEVTTIQADSTTTLPQLSNPGTLRETAGGPNVSGIRAVLFSAVALAIGCGVTTWVSRGRYEKLTGYLQARTHSVSCDREVRLTQLLAPQGKTIVSGAPLVKLENAQLPIQLLKQKQLITELTDEVAETEAKVQLAVEHERNEIQREILATKLQIAQLEGQRFEKELEEVSLIEFGSNLKDGVVDAGGHDNVLDRLPKPLVLREDQFSDEKIKKRLQREQLKNFKETVAARIELCNRHLAELVKKSTELPETVRRSMGLHRVQLALENAKTELASLEQQQQSLTINAPGTGIVGVYRKGVGSHFAPHEEIVQVLDEDQPHLLLQIPSNRVADFTAGTIVELKFPGGKCGQGKVAEVPPQTVNAPGIAVSETQMAVQIVPSGLLWPRLPINTMVEINRTR